MKILARLAPALTATMIGVLAAPALAQDYNPSMSAHDSMSQQQFSTQQTELANHRLRESVRRNNGGTSSRTARTCANVPVVRKRLGVSNPKVRELARLCRMAGY